MANILLLVDGSGGDVLPLMRIGGALKKAGHQITLLTHCVYQERASQAGLNFVALDTPQEYERMLSIMDKALYPQDILVLFKEHLLQQIPTVMRVIEGHLAPGETILITSNTFSRIIGQMAAEKLDIPLAIIFGAPSTISAEPRLANIYGKMLAADLNRARAQIRLSPIHDWEAWGKLFQQSIGVWPEWFAPPEPGWPAQLALIGFMHQQSSLDALPSDVAQALADETPVLITHGTSIPADPHFFKASVKACELLNHRAILVTKYADLVPHPLPEQVKWFKQLPFDLLMPRVRAVIHHGGLGTAAQALAAARPQLVLPLGFDRPDNAARLRRLGVAEFLRPPQWNSQAIAEALYRLMHSPDVQACCQALASRFQSVDPLAAACKVIEDLIHSGVSAHGQAVAPHVAKQHAGVAIQPAKHARKLGQHGARKVLLTTMGTWGDVNPFLRMGQGLKERGYTVALLSHCRYEEQARFAGLDFLALDTPNEYEQFVTNMPQLQVPSKVLPFFRQHVLPNLAAAYRTIVDWAASSNTLLVARAMPGMAALMASETLGSPLVSVLMAPSDLKTMPLIESAIGAVLGAPLNRVRAEVGLPPLHDWPTWLRSPKKYMGIWPEWFAAPGSGWSFNLALIGFLAHQRGTGTLPEHMRAVWQADQHPILITHGTSTAADPKALAASVDACRVLGHHGLLVTPYRELVPDPLPAGIQWLDYAPFADLMPHLTAVIHHGGLGTLQQALAAGVPQLILPDSAERKENAICLHELGAGAWLPPAQWQSNRIADSLHQLIHSAQVHTRCQELSAWIHADDPLASACDLIERLLSDPDQRAVAEATPSAAIEHSSTTTRAKEQPFREQELLAMTSTLSAERRALLTRRLQSKQQKRT